MKQKPLLLLPLLALLLLPSQAKADSLNISEILSKFPALNQGIAYSVKDSRFNYLATADLVSWKGITLEGGYAGRAKNTGDKIVGVVSYDLVNFKSLGVNVPILDLIILRPGIYAGFGSIDGKALGDSEFDWGVSATIISLKF